MTPVWWAAAAVLVVLAGWFGPELVFILLLTVWLACSLAADLARWVWAWVRR